VGTILAIGGPLTYDVQIGGEVQRRHIDALLPNRTSRKSDKTDAEEMDEEERQMEEVISDHNEKGWQPVPVPQFEVEPSKSKFQPSPVPPPSPSTPFSARPKLVAQAQAAQPPVTRSQPTRTTAAPAARQPPPPALVDFPSQPRRSARTHKEPALKFADEYCGERSTKPP
jgi:hypothetical protein